MPTCPGDHSRPVGGQPTAPPTAPATVFVVDDDGAFRTAVARLLRASGFAVQCYGTAAEFLARAACEGSSCVLLDLQMPGLNGLELQEALARQPGHRPPVVFLTGHGDIPAAVQAMRLGAEDFLAKCAPKEQLLAAVRRALARDACQRRVEEQQAAVRAQFATLSPREHEVLQHVLKGKLNKQIAADLDIHERTVKMHRTAITSKLGAPSVAELAHLWMQAGYATAPSLQPSPPARTSGNRPHANHETSQ